MAFSGSNHPSRNRCRWPAASPGLPLKADLQLVESGMAAAGAAINRLAAAARNTNRRTRQQRVPHHAGSFPAPKAPNGGWPQTGAPRTCVCAVGQTDIAEEDAVTTDQQRHREKKASRHQHIEIERLGDIHKRGDHQAHIEAADPSAKRIALPRADTREHQGHGVIEQSDRLRSKRSLASIKHPGMASNQGIQRRPNRRQDEGRCRGLMHRIGDALHATLRPAAFSQDCPGSQAA